MGTVSRQEPNIFSRTSPARFRSRTRRGCGGWGSLLVLLLAGLTASPAAAWWDAGHKLTAALAFHQLSPAQRKTLLAWLQQHPRWQTDFLGKLPPDISREEHELLDEWLFQQAAVWPDLIGGIPGGERDRFHRPTWHYVNYPLFLTPEDRQTLRSAVRSRLNLRLDPPTEELLPDLNILQAWKLAHHLAAHPSTSPDTRAIMLCWLMHTTGDIHQPLHSTALFSRHLFPEGCRGGNLVKTRQRRNLHALWDSLPGERLSAQAAKNKALSLMSQPDLQRVAQEAVARLDVEVWCAESRALVRDVVYDAEVLTPLRQAEALGAQEPPVIDLSEDYLRRSGKVAEERVVAAGLRLHRILAELVKTP